MNKTLTKNLLSLRKRIYNAIEDGILSGKYITGEKISEARLTHELGVSRTPVREALSQLATEGLVELVPNRGALVKGVTQEDIRDIFEIRALIEGLAAKRAAENITEALARELTDAIDLEEFYTLKGKPGHLMVIDSRFHECIYRASNSRPLIRMLKTFHHYVRQARNLSLSVPGRAGKALDEHKAILAAILDRNGEKASMLTEKHVQNARKNLLKALGEG